MTGTGAGVVGTLHSDSFVIFGAGEGEGEGDGEKEREREREEEGEREGEREGEGVGVGEGEGICWKSGERGKKMITVCILRPDVHWIVYNGVLERSLKKAES